MRLSKDDFQKYIDLIKSHTNVPSDKSAAAIKSKLQIMNYIGTICSESCEMANAFVEAEIYKELSTIIKSGHNLEMYFENLKK